MSDVSIRAFFREYWPNRDLGLGLRQLLFSEPVRPMSLRWWMLHGFCDDQTGFVKQTWAAYDQVTRGFDDNGIPLNPVLGSQTWDPPQLADPSLCGGGKPWEAPCTNQTTWLDTTWICALAPGSLSGHANWGLATYEGHLYWHDHSNYLQDDDYSFSLYRPDLAGNTAGDVRKKEYGYCEFNSDQTINHFHTWYWQALHEAVDDDGGKGGQTHDHWPKTRALFDGKQAIVMGLSGLDCAHECGHEIHPVFAMAVKVIDDVEGNVEHEAWSIFVRNWGDEGFCSSGQEYIYREPFRFTFRFRKPGATGVTAIPADPSDHDGQAGTLFFSNDLPGTGWSGPQLVPNEGALVSFFLPPPDQRQRINGMLHLRWEISSEPSMDSKSRPQLPDFSSSTGDKEGEAAEGALRQLLQDVTPAQRDALEGRVAELAAPNAAPPDLTTVERLPWAVTQVVTPGSVPRVVNVPDAARKQWQNQVMQVLRDVFGDRIPAPPQEDDVR